MALYKDTRRCRNCGKNFTWYYQSAQEGEYVHRPLSDEDTCVQVSGMMLVADQIYEVVVDCPFCRAQNEFNCKIEQELPGLKSRIQ